VWGSSGETLKIFLFIFTEKRPHNLFIVSTLIFSLGEKVGLTDVVK